MDITVDTTVTKILDGGESSIKTSATIYLGGPGVATSGATKGYPIAAADGHVKLPAFGHPMYAVCATSATVSVLQ